VEILVVALVAVVVVLLAARGLVTAVTVTSA